MIPFFEEKKNLLFFFFVLKSSETYAKNKLFECTSPLGTTLLHYLASTMIREEPDCADFEDGLLHFAAAERVNVDSIKASIARMNKQITNIGNDLRQHKQQHPDDRCIFFPVFWKIKLKYIFFLLFFLYVPRRLYGMMNK